MRKQEDNILRLIFRFLKEDTMIYDDGNIIVNASIHPGQPYTFSITWNEGETPAYREETFGSAEACAKRMLEIADYGYWEKPQE